MGQVYTGIHERMALMARDVFGLRTLVETGTYKGDTAIWAHDKFDKVVTIEISDSFNRYLEKRFYGIGNILYIKGDSRRWLSSVCRGRDNQPTLFWLDAHWTGEMTDPDPLGCPLLDEIRIINQDFFGMHVIMVDDYLTISRLNWAPHEEIMRLLVDKDKHDRQVRIQDDVYFAAHRIPDGFEKWKK